MTPVKTSIIYPKSCQSDKVLEAAKDYEHNTLAYDTYIELSFGQTRFELDCFVQRLIDLGVPFDLTELSSGYNAPHCFRYRPEIEYKKSINCLLYTGDEGQEDGLIRVSELLALMGTANEANLSALLMEKIKSNSFMSDNVCPIIDL